MGNVLAHLNVYSIHIAPGFYVDGRTSILKFFCSLRSDMYSCMICYIKNKIDTVKEGTQKCYLWRKYRKSEEADIVQM